MQDGWFGSRNRSWNADAIERERADVARRETALEREYAQLDAERERKETEERQ
jgi:hypothetical protein